MGRRYLTALAAVVMVSGHASHAPAEPLMYVPTGASNEIVVIDLATHRIIDRIGDLENAHGLATSPGTEYLVAGSMVRRGPGEGEGPAKPSAMTEAEHRAHHAGKQAAEGPSEPVASYVSIVHAKHRKVMRRIAVRGLTHHTAVSPDGRMAVAVHSDAGGISVIDLGRMAVVKAVPTGPVPNYAVFTSDGKRLYVSNAGDGTVSEIDTGDWKVARTFRVGAEPEHMALSADGATLFVANVGDGTVAAVHLATGATRATYPVGPRPHGIDVSRDGHWLFASAKGGDQLTRIALESGESRRVPLAPAPYHLEYVEATGRLYVSSREAPLIWVVDPSTLKVTATIDLGGGVAHQMVVRGE